MSRLNECVQTLKTRIGDSVEAALEYLEKILKPSSTRYNDYIQIKSRFNSLQRELLLGLIDHPTFDTGRNNISNAILLLADDIREDDLLPEPGTSVPGADKRGDILYNIPDTMQLQREEKCAVRIAWSELLLTRDWEASSDDVLRDIRVSDIMAVQLLNVDESNPFAIRTLSETVQFIDKDDFTEWIFYVKPLQAGKFPLVLRVSVIEMINNKEYKKDIVLEEEINVSAEEVPQPLEVAFKSAHAPIMTGNAAAEPLASVKAPEAPPAPAAEAAPAGSSKTVSRLLAAVLTTVVLAASAFWGIPALQEYMDQTAYHKAHGKGSVDAYEEYLKEHPEGKFAVAARAGIDSLLELERHLAKNNEVPADSTGEENDRFAEIIEEKTEIPVKNPTKPAEDIRATPPQKGASKPPTKKPKNKPDLVEDEPKNVAEPHGPANDTTSKPPSNDPDATTDPLLKGKVKFLKISEFSIVDARRQTISFRYYKYNDAQEVLSFITLRGPFVPVTGQWIEFVPLSGGNPVRIPLQHISNRTESGEYVGYFTYGVEVLLRLSEEKIGRIKITDTAGKIAYEEAVLSRAADRLMFRGQEALAKVNQ